MRGLGRRTGIILGMLFILPLFLYGYGSSLLDSIFELKTSQKDFAEMASSFELGGFLIIGNSLIVLAIAILLFPPLWKRNRQVAIAYLLTRVIESILLLLGLVTALSFASVVQNSSLFDSIQVLNLERFSGSVNFLSFQIAMLVLGLGSIPAFCLLHIEKLIPRVLSIWACLGYGLLFVGSCAELIGYPYGVMLAIPGGIFEITFGAWLILKGLVNE